MIKEFKEFIARGNVMNLAVGVVVGGAFSKITASLVDNIIMPLVGILLGGVDFSSLSFKLKNATVHYGLFIQNVVDFFIIAFCVFIMVKILNKLSTAIEKESKITKKKFKKFKKSLDIKNEKK